MEGTNSRPTLEDVAREARVSIATVDRVVNRRDGVHARTASRVQSVIARLNYRPDNNAARLARNRDLRFCFILPTGTNSFVELLAAQVRATAAWLATQRAFVETMRVDVFDPEALADCLDTSAAGFDGVATVALDHPLVRASIDELASRGVAVATLVSDAPAARRTRYVGIDNAAAGRTAGTLMGRFIGARSGTVGVIAGSMSLRDHAERLLGFTQVLQREYRTLTMLPVREGRDDTARNAALTSELLASHEDLAGIYNIGAGNRGVAASLEASGRANSVVYIGHELTEHTRRFLMRGVMDACINQDAGHEIRSAARVLLAACHNEPLVADQERIRIDIFVRDNLP